MPGTWFREETAAVVWVMTAESIRYQNFDRLSYQFFPAVTE
jgi:hypothetical protein